MEITGEEVIKPETLPQRIRKASASNKAIAENKEKDFRSVWGLYNSTVEDYERRNFRNLLGRDLLFRRKHIVDFIKQRTDPVVIDLMAPSGTLESLFEKIRDKPKFGLAVSLSDSRSDSQKAKDEKLGIKQLEGDIMLSQTWDEIKHLLNGRKADVIMERAEDGLNYLPRNERLYAILLNKAWKLLSDNNGMLLIQCPDSMVKSVNLKKWIECLNKVGINCKSNQIYGHRGYKGFIGHLKIVKTPNSPKELPFLR